MKLITYADSNAAKRLTKFLIDKGNAIGVILYLVGIAVYLLLPHEKLVRRQFFDEKALMTGYAKPQYSSSDLSNINQLVENYRHMNKLSVNEWFGRSLQDVGLEVYCQNFTASIPDGDSSVINGTNVYGIIRGRRSPSIEAMVVMATEEDQESNYAVPFLVNMAEYLSNCNFWSKDIIVLLTTNKVFGTQAWLDSYLGLENHIIQSDKLKGKSGAIQSVINIEVPSLGYVEYINIIPSNRANNWDEAAEPQTCCFNGNHFYMWR